MERLAVSSSPPRPFSPPGHQPLLTVGRRAVDEVWSFTVIQTGILLKPKKKRLLVLLFPGNAS